MSTSSGSPSVGVMLSHTPAEVLAMNTDVAKPFWVSKFKKEAPRNWDLFYKTHQTNFFKDRHWTDSEFPELAEMLQADEGKVLLEVGCGVGNFIWPLLAKTKHTRFHCCDFSQNAVSLIHSSAQYDAQRVHAFVHDLTSVEGPSLKDKLRVESWGFADNSNNEGEKGVDVVSCVFVLSALAPENVAGAVKAMAETLAPGGSILFRDYALHDASQLRFHLKPSSSYATVPSLLSSSQPLYKRSDGTMSYFFSPEEVDKMFVEAGLVGGCEVVERLMANRKEGWELARRFVQGKWVKPVPTGITSSNVAVAE